MRASLFASCLAVVLAVPAVMAYATPSPKRDADAILKDVDAVATPKFDQAKQKEPGYVQGFIKAQQAAMAKKAALIGELYQADPGNTKLVKLMPERWNGLMRGGSGDSKANIKALNAEVDDVLAHAKAPALKTEAAFFKGMIPLMTGEGPEAVEEALKGVDTLAKLAPDDERVGQLLFIAASSTEDTAKQTALYTRVAKEYPKSRYAKMAEGSLKKLASVGKPFELEFTDAIKGTEVSIKALKGKVVVVDFWATWCGPCVAEMPTMKKLYAEFKPKGVEFIGVSLDNPKEEGGLDKVKDYVAKNEIAWPQYYQGNGWQSEFSSRWGINSIPSLFVVDTEGNLASINARGKLETLIPELLKKKGDATAGGDR